MRGAQPDHLIELRADLLAWVASSRAVLAFAPGGVLRGCEAAVLVRGGRRSTWLVRGRPPFIGPAWVTGVAFDDAVRGGEGSRVGRLLGRGGSDGGLVCGLCGGFPSGSVRPWVEGWPSDRAQRRGEG